MKKREGGRKRERGNGWVRGFGTGEGERAVENGGWGRCGRVRLLGTNADKNSDTLTILHEKMYVKRGSGERGTRG